MATLDVTLASLAPVAGFAQRASCPVVLVLLTTVACGGTLDAGWDEPRGPIPVDERNPVILCNDGAFDNWQGEHAILFANSGGPSLAAIVINAAWPWTDISENMAGWQQMVDAARESGLEGIPNPVASESPALVRPEDENIEATQPNGSEGARLIVELSRELSEPSRPVTVVTGGTLTDIADAYLMDPTLPDRIVVISALGTTKPDGAAMGLPNGQLDTWADVIVAQRFRYVQVTGYSYDTSADVLSGDLSGFPDNEFMSWVGSKQSSIENAMDQVAVLVAALPSTITEVVQVEQSAEDEEGIPLLVSASNGPAQVVSGVANDAGTERLREVLLDPTTFHAE